MSTIQIKSNLSIDELIGNLSQLDTPTLNYLIAALRKVQVDRKIPLESNMLQEDAFWNFIEKIDWQQKEEVASLKPLVDALTASSITVIYQFSERLAFLLHQLDGPEYAQPLEKGAVGFSADTFLYARCLVIAKGKKSYQQVIKRPASMPVDADFEALLYVTEQAYQQKTGKAYTYIPTVNYESFLIKHCGARKR